MNRSVLLLVVDRGVFHGISRLFCTHRLDVDGVPFSPPAHDDSFFYIRYPSAANPSSSSGGNNNARMSLADQIRASTEKDKASALQMGQISAAVKEMALDGAGKAATLDLSKHTEPCRQYLAGANSKWNWKSLFMTFQLN